MVLIISFIFINENITVKKIIGVVFGVICIYLLY